MKRFLQISLWLLVGVAGVKGQNAMVGTGFSTGWGGGSCPTGNSNFNYLSTSVGGTYILTTTSAATGDRFWRFGVDWSGTTAQLTNSPGNNTVVTPNTTYNLNTGCTTNGALQYNVSSTSNNYVFKTLNAGTNPTGTWVFFEVQGAVNTISSIVQSPLAANVFPGQAVTVTANMSGIQSTGQNVYLRYTTGNFSTSTVVNMTYSGTTATATIPASINTPGSAISYYVFTSGTANVASDGGNADLYTINLNNNGGSNYSYTVASGWTTAATGSWTTPGTWTANAVPPTTESMGTVNIGHAVTGDANALFSILNINGTNTLTQNTGTTFTTTGSITINGGANYNMNGNLQINAGGFVNGTSGTLTYGASSTLIYNSGGNYGVNNEWSINAVSGNRVPANVTVGNGVNTQINFGVTDNQVRTLRGNLTINSGSTVTLSTGANSNLQVGGNFNNSGTFTHNSRSVIFNGTAAQTITGNTTFAAINNINGSTNAVSIANGTTVTLSTTGTFTTANSSFVVNGTLINNGNINLNNATAGITVNGTLTNTSTVTVTSGTLSFSATGIYNHNITGSPGTIPTATWHPSSNCNIIGALTGGTLNGMNQTFGNFTVNFSGTGNVSVAGVPVTIEGNFNIDGTGTGSFRLAADASTGVFLVRGNFSQTNGTFDLSSGTSNHVMELRGNFNKTNGTFTESGTGLPQVNFNSILNQNINVNSISNSISFRLSNSAGITITGSLPINTGATFFRQAGSVTSGTIAYNATNSTLAYTGGSMTTENGEWPATNGPVNVTLNTAAAVDVITLHAARTLAATGVFTLTQGSMELNNNDLTISNTATNSLAGTGFGASKMIRTSGTGRLFRGIGTGTNNNYNFPIGETTVTTEYSPYELRMASNATAFQVGVRVVDGNAPNVNNPAAPSEYLSRHWLTSVGGSPTNYAYTAWLTFINTVSDVVGGSTANLSVSEYNGSSWVAAATNVNVAVLEGSAGAFTQATAPLGTGEFTGRNNTINFTWTGATNNEWNVSTNWTPTGTPAATDIATVNSGGTPNISNGVNALVRDLIVAAGASLTVQSGGSITIGGTLTTGGTFTFNCGSTVNFNSAAAQTIPALSYGNLNISGGTRTLASGTINVCNNFTPTAGTITTTGNTVRFNGTTVQSILTNAGNFNNLTIANTAATVTSNVAITFASGGALTVDANARLDMATNSLTLTGTTSVVNGFLRSAGAITGATALTLNFSATGTYEHNFTTTAGTIPTATWDAGSTCAVIGYTSNTNGLAGLNQPFSNFTWNTPSISGSYQLSGSLTNVSGTLRISSTGTPTVRSLRLVSSNGSPYTANFANIIVDAGTLSLLGGGSAGSNSSNINVSGSITINGGTFDFNDADNGGNVILNIGGSFAQSGTGIIRRNVNSLANNSFINFNGSLNQSITVGTSTNIQNILNYTLNNSNGITITGTLPVNNNATFTRTQGTVIGTVTYGTGTTLIYNNTAAVTQTDEWPAASGPVNLTISGTGGVNMSGSRTVAGTVTLSAAAGSLNLAGYTLTLNNGSAAQSVTGAAGNSFTISSSPGGGILSTTGTGNRTITLSNFGTSSSAGLIIGTGATLQMNNNAILNVGGNGTTISMLTVAGTLQVNSTTNSNIASGTAPFYTNTSTLEYRIAYGAFQEWLAGTALTTPGVPQNVIVNNSTGNVTIPGARSALGNFTITSGTFLPSGTLSVGGNWSNTGTFTPNSQTVIFMGSASQSITRTGGETFFNLTLNNTAGLVPANAITVTNTLTLTAGNITLSNNNLSITSGNDISGSPFSAGNMIVTNGTGKLIFSTLTNKTYTYPVGETTGTTEYSPIRITFTAGTGVGTSLGMQVVDAAVPANPLDIPAAPADYLTRHWVPDAQGFTTATWSGSIDFLAADEVGNRDNIRFSAWHPAPNNAWVDYGTGPTGQTLNGTSVTATDALLTTAYITGRAPATKFYFRSNASIMNWSNAANWQTSLTVDFASPATATFVPSALNSLGIIIISGNTVTIDAAVSLDQTVIQNNAILVKDNADLTINNGAGIDLEIQNGGLFRHATTTGDAATFVDESEVWVRTGGTIEVTQTAGGPSVYGTGPNMFYETDAVFDYRTNNPFLTSNVTYFQNAGPTVIPIFRLSVSLSLPVGAGVGNNTTINGLFEANGNVTWQNEGIKTFRNGITGTGTVTQSSNCGQFRINGTTSQLGVATLTLRNDVNSGLALQAGTCTLSAPVVANSGPIYIDNGAVMISDAVNAISGSASYTLNSGATLSTAHASGVDGTILLNTVSMNSGSNYIFNGTVNQATGTKMAASPGTVTINNTGGSGSNTVTLSNAGTTATTLNLTNGIFSIGNNVQFNIANNGAVNATSGSLASGNAAGTINFLGTGTVNATATLNFWNVNLPAGSGGVNFGSTGNPTIHNELVINNNRFVDVNAPFYANTSTLVYNSGNTFLAANEWFANVQSGRGVPHHVRIGRAGTNNTQLSFDISNAYRQCLGDITIGDGTGSGFGLSLGTNPGGDLRVSGNWLRYPNGVFTTNNRAVFFTGNGNTQTITVNGSGTETFAYFIVDKPAGNVQLDANTNVTVAGNIGGNNLQLLSGNIDLNGRTFEWGGSGNLQTDGALREIFSATTATFRVTGGNRAVQSSNSGTLVFNNQTIVEIAAGLDFGLNTTTINATLQINAGGFANNNAPIYGPNGILIYNNGGEYLRRVEWSGTEGTPGFPNDVIIQNNSFVKAGGSSGSAINTPFAARRDVTIQAGSTLSMDLETNTLAMDESLNVGRDILINGTLTASSNSGSDVYVGRNWFRSGIFTANNRAVFFNTAQAGSIEYNGGTETFPFVVIDKSGGASTQLTLNSPVDITNKLTLTSGSVITTTSNLLRITNSAPDDATNGIEYTDGNPAYIDGPLRREVNTTSGSNSYVFPVGRLDGSTHFAKRIRMKELTNGAGSFTVTYERGNPPGGIPYTFQDIIKGIRESEYWNVDRTTGSTQGRIVLPYNYLPGNTWKWIDGSNVTPNLIARVAVVRGSGPNWNFTDPLNSAFSTEGSEPEGRLVNTDGDISSRHIDAFSPFTFGWGLNQVLILPLKLLGFTAKATGPDVLLQWQFADAKDLAYTTIEHSTDGQRFGPLQRVAGTTAPHYSHTHLQPGSGVHYYRLLMADKNGETSFSAVQVVQIGVNQSYITGLLQNPVQGTQALVQGYSATAQTARVLLTDVQGRRLLAANYQLAQGSFSLPVSLLPVAKGNYYLQLMLNDGTSKTMKVVY